jgi:hypothetical protein
MTIDTLEYVKKLEAAGVERTQAEAHAHALRGAVEAQLATKNDLELAVLRLEKRFETLLWRHSLSIIAVIIAVAGVLARFLR